MRLSLYWAIVFLTVAFLIAIQPACQGWIDLPVNKVMVEKPDL